MSSPPTPKRARWETGLMRPHGDSFIGSASGIHFVQTVYNAVPKAGLPSHVVPGEDDQLPSSTPETLLWRHNELNPRYDEQIHLQDLLDWSQSYFDYWHPAFPFLHAPTVVQWLSELCNGQLSMSLTVLTTMQMVIIRSVLSISLADSRQSGLFIRLPSALIFQSYDEAIQAIQPVLVNRPSIESVQAAMSIQLFLISMLRLNGASRIQGIILRLIFQLGIHRCPKRYNTFTVSEVANRQRIFWSVYVIDRYLSQCLGFPLTLRDDDVDVCFLDHEIHALSTEEGREMDSRLAFCNFIAKHAQVKGHVIELCNKSINHRQSSVDAFQGLNTKITKWANELDEYIENCPIHAPGFSHAQHSTLNVLKHEITISLNRPLLTAPKSSPEYAAALQTCISASRSIINELHRVVQITGNTEDPSITGDCTMPPFLAWPFLTWSVWMSGFLILFAAAEKEVSRQAAIKLSHQTVAILKHLSARGSVWPNACAAAIRDLTDRFRAGSQSDIENSSAATTDMSDKKQRNASSSGMRSAGESQSDRFDDHEGRVESDVRNISTIPVNGTAIRNDVHGDTEDLSIPDGITTNPPPLNSDVDTIPRPNLRPYGSGDVFLQDMFPDGSDLGQIDMSLFSGFDIPFWMDDDQYASLADCWDPTWNNKAMDDTSHK